MQNATTLARRTEQFAEAVSVLAEEASQLALTTLGEGHDAAVAARAADNAREAVERLHALAREEPSMDDVMQAAAWAISSAAVAVAQAKLGTPGRDAR